MNKYEADYKYLYMQYKNKYNKLLKELCDACAICIDKVGIDVEKTFPEIWKVIKGETK